MTTGGVAKYVARVSTIPMGILGPIIIALSTIGTFAIRNNMFDVYIMLGFGLFGYIMRRTGFSPAPMVLGMVLSNICENNWRRAVMLGNAKGGIIQYFLGRPISIVLAVLILLSLFSPILMNYINKKAQSSAGDKEKS